MTHAAMILASTLSFYTISYHGGEYDKGTVFAYQDKEAVPIYSFCHEPHCVDGANPVGNLIVTVDNGQITIIGVTEKGGRENTGVLYELTGNDSGDVWQEQVLWNFGSLFNDDDGKSPTGALFQDSQGWLVGTTRTGGFYGHGVLWEWKAFENFDKFTVLKSFGHRW